ARRTATARSLPRRCEPPMPRRSAATTAGPASASASAPTTTARRRTRPPRRAQPARPADKGENPEGGRHPAGHGPPGSRADGPLGCLRLSRDGVTRGNGVAYGGRTHNLRVAQHIAGVISAGVQPTPHAGGCSPFSRTATPASWWMVRLRVAVNRLGPEIVGQPNTSNQQLSAEDAQPPSRNGHARALLLRWSQTPQPGHEGSRVVNDVMGPHQVRAHEACQNGAAETRL